MKRSSRANPPPRLHSLPPSSSEPPPPPPSRRITRPLRRRVRNLALIPGTGRRWGVAAGGGGQRSRPTTPLLRWKYEDADLSSNPKPPPRLEAGDAEARRKARAVATAAGSSSSTIAVPVGPVSARKLAAGIWQLQLPGFGVSAKNAASRPIHGYLHSPHLCKLSCAGLRRSHIEEVQGSAPVPDLGHGTSSKAVRSFALPHPAMERATKWDPGSSRTSDEVFRFYDHLKLPEDRQATSVSVASAIQSELEGARARIHELEDERRLLKKKLDRFLKKVAEEKASWRIREHEKVRAVIDDMKDALSREKKNRQRMEIVNSKLVNELAEAKLTAKRYLQDYEKERKARELVEEVCDELAKEIGEDKDEVEALKRESLKIREEVEEERRMLQMAEVWREERVQMKLIDAKLTLEEKYSWLKRLQSDVESFIQIRCSSMPGAADLKEAELLRDAIDLAKIHEVKEFVYHPPPASEDIFSVFEELQAGKETSEGEIEQCYGYSPASRASKIHTVSPEINRITENNDICVNGMVYTNGDVEDDSGWETISQAEEQGSSNSLDGSDLSVNDFCGSNASVSGTGSEENGGNGNATSEKSGVFSVDTKQSRKKIPSIARLWRSSPPNNAEKCKPMPTEVLNGRLSNGRISIGTLSPDVEQGDSGLSPMNMGQWSSPDSVNPHVMRGMKGCIEWPRGAQKHSLKAKLLEARMESQKVQLRQVLKQKI